MGAGSLIGRKFAADSGANSSFYLKLSPWRASFNSRVELRD
jgi:hypothetical protein